MAMEEEALRIVLEESRRSRRVEMRGLPIGVLRVVVWCHALLLSSLYLRRVADIVMAVCRWVPAQR
jgi:hypothetical protein